MTTAAIRGNEGTDFCLVIWAQCLVCWSVCPEILSRTQQTAKVQKFVDFSLKPLHLQGSSTPSLKAIHRVGHFPADSTHANYMHVVGSALWCIHQGS